MKLIINSNGKLIEQKSIQDFYEELIKVFSKTRPKYEKHDPNK